MSFKHNFKVLKNDDLRHYMWSQILWQIGIWTLNNSYALLAFNVSEKSPVSLGYVSFSMGLGVVCATLFGSELPNRIAKKKIILILQIIQIVCTSFVAFMLFSGFLYDLAKYQYGGTVFSISTIIIYTMNFTCGAMNGLHFSANMMFIKDLVPIRQFKKAISINSIIVNFARFIGPAIAAFFIAYASYAYTFVFAALIFLPIGYIVIKLNYQEYCDITRKKEKANFRPTLKFITTDYRARGLFFTALMTALLCIPMFKFAPAIANGDPKDTGIILSSLGSASLFCLFFVVPIANKVKRTGMVITFACIWAFFWFSIFPLYDSLLWICICFFGTGLGTTTVMVMAMSNIQLITPAKLQAKVLSIFSMILFATPPFATTLFSYIVDAIGTSSTLNYTAITGLYCSVLIVIFARNWMTWVDKKE